MNPQAIEVALDHNDTLVAGGRRTVEIKYLPRFAETDRKFVLRLPAVHRTAGVGDPLATRVTDWNHDAPAQQTGSAIETHPKLDGRSPIDSALDQVTMGRIHTRQSKR